MLLDAALAASYSVSGEDTEHFDAADPIHAYFGDLCTKYKTQDVTHAHLVQQMLRKVAENSIADKGCWTHQLTATFDSPQYLICTAARSNDECEIWQRRIEAHHVLRQESIEREEMIQETTRYWAWIQLLLSTYSTQAQRYTDARSKWISAQRTLNTRHIAEASIEFSSSEVSVMKLIAAQDEAICSQEG